MPFDLCKIGELLKTAREERGLTYDQVSTALFIRKRVIEAIEAGNWENLPHPVYVRGYVTQYTAFLKVQDAVEATMLPAAPEPITAPSDEMAPTPAKPQKERARSKPWDRKKIIGAAVLGAAVIGFFVFQNLPRPSYVTRPAQSAENTYQTAAVTATPAAANPQEASAVTTQTDGTKAYQALQTSSVESADVNQNQPAASSDKQEDSLVLEKKKLTITCQERTWLRIIIDGTQTKEFMLNPEEVVILNAKDCFDLLIGNAAGVKLIYNGKDLGFSGQAGEVKHINLS